MKANALNVSAELSLSVVTLPVSVSGSAKLLRDQKTSARSVRTTFMCEVKTKVEKLGLFHDKLKQFISLEALKVQNATHVVVAVTWGGGAYVSAEIDEDQMLKDKQINGSLQANLKAMMIEASGKVELDWSERTKSLAKRVSTKVYGDVLPDKSDELPITFEAACRQVHELRTRIGQANNGKGKPMSYTLFPLADRMFRTHLAMSEATVTIYRRIEEAPLMECAQLFDNILAVKQVVEDFVNDCNRFGKCLDDEVVTKARQLHSSLVSGEATLRNQVGNALRDIRAGTENVSKLDELKVKYLAGDSSYYKIKDSYDKDFVAAKNKMDLSRTCDDFGVVYMKGNESLKRLLTQNDVVYVLYASDDLMIKDQSGWNTNHNAFFIIAKMIRYDFGSRSEYDTEGSNEISERPVLVFVDCTFNPLPDAVEATKNGVCVIHYKNAQVHERDVAMQQATELSKNMARSSKVDNVIADVDRKRIDLNIRCPGVRRGECEHTRRQWICQTCRQPLQLGVRFDNVYCQCGRAAATTFTFRCQDTMNHKPYEFKSFMPGDLQFELMSLRRSSDAAVVLSNSLRLTANGHINELFLDGVYEVTNLRHARDKNTADILQIPADTSVIAIHVTGQATQMPTLMVSDTAGLFTTGWKVWKYITGPTVAYNWMLPTFDDSSWQVAVTERRHLATYRSQRVKGIDWTAAWIRPKTVCQHVYFRMCTSGFNYIEHMPTREVIVWSNTLRITADDIISEFYINGVIKVIALPNASSWKETDTLQLPEGTSLIAIHAIDIWGEKKLLVEDTLNKFTTGMVTWKYCAAPVDKDWMMPHFDDSRWEDAVIVNRLTLKPEGIRRDTKWIWATNSGSDVYFRCRCANASELPRPVRLLNRRFQRVAESLMSRVS